MKSKLQTEARGAWPEAKTQRLQTGKKPGACNQLIHRKALCRHNQLLCSCGCGQSSFVRTAANATNATNFNAKSTLHKITLTSRWGTWHLPAVAAGPELPSRLPDSDPPGSTIAQNSSQHWIRSPFKQLGRLERCAINFTLVERSSL